MFQDLMFSHSPVLSPHTAADWTLFPGPCGKLIHVDCVAGSACVGQHGRALQPSWFTVRENGKLTVKSCDNSSLALLEVRDFQTKN